MSMPRRALVAVAVIAAGLTAACTPEQVAVFKTLDPASQQAVLAHLAAQDRPRGCVEAMRRVWPPHLWGWAETVMWRESRHIPTARNPSGASGCFQMMLPLHSRRFTAVGCSPGQWADPWCNAAAAWTLYRDAGRSPWALTA